MAGYKDAPNLSADDIEKMWRALDRIAAANEALKPGHVDYMSKAQIAELARQSLPAATATS